MEKDKDAAEDIQRKYLEKFSNTPKSKAGDKTTSCNLHNEKR